MKRILFIVVIAIAAGFINSAVGQIIWYNNVQYRITADNSPYGYYQVVVHHYDTTDAVMQETTTGITTSKAVENRTKEIKSSIVDNL